MKSMIYYPGFEMKDERQLKFALLYMDNLRPIIPDMPIDKNQYLSESAIRIMHETDFITPYFPQYNEANSASILACKEFDGFLQAPERYAYLFTGNHHTDMIERWRNPQIQYCNLYSGKYSTVFFDYCLKNKIATEFQNENGEGIRISEDLAFAYMSILADIISKKEEKEMFTDIRRYDRFLLHKDYVLAQRTQQELIIAENKIDCIIPDRLEHIPLERIIELRNNQEFQRLRKGFVKQFKNYLEIKEDNPGVSLEEALRLKREIYHFISATFGITASIGLSFYTFKSLQNGQVSLPEALANVYLDIEVLKNFRYGMREYLDDLKTKIQAKRYIAKLNNFYNY